MTRGNCTPTDSVQSIDDDYFSLIHNIGTGACCDLDKTNPAYLVGYSYDMSGWQYPSQKRSV